MDDKVTGSQTAITNPSPEALTEMLLETVKLVSGHIGDRYFEAVASYLCNRLGMDIACIVQLMEGTPATLQTKAVFSEGELNEGFTYTLADTPCEQVLESNKLCIHDYDVQQRFPADTFLKKHGIESYVGAPLVSSTGKTLGIMIALGRTPISNKTEIEACFDMLAGRTAAEMERLLAEQDARRLSQVAEQSPVSVLITDTQGTIEYANKHFEITTGFTRAEVIGESHDVLNPARQANNPELWRALSAGNNWSSEIQSNRKDGSLLWERISIGPLRNPANELIGYIEIKRDISQRKADEKELRLAASVFDTATEAVMVTDTNNRILRVNKAFTQITGYETAEVLGKNPSILQSGHHDMAFYQALFEALETTGVWSGEIWNRRKNGEAYPEWLTISEIRDAAGKLEGYASLFSDITQRKQHESRIQQQANFDALTGLPNRRLLYDRLSRSLEMAERNNHPVGLLVIDLNRFKQVNDELGHSTGDQLLQVAARRLLKAMPKSATVARLGGDEFAIVASGFQNRHGIENLVTQVLETSSQRYELSDHRVYLSASIGVSVFPDDGNDSETLLRKAATAMYQAKDKGSNNFQFFDLQMDNETRLRRSMEMALRHALEHDEFHVEFQPVVDTDTGLTTSTEALIRWNHPQKGLVSPVDFIPLAEQTGLIIAIGEWVLREACRAAASWAQVTDRPPSVSVNLSHRQLEQDNIVDLIKTVLEETGLAPNRLTLEMTESLLITDDDQTMSKLTAIRNLGIELSIDDFGTGFSALSYLKKFPISILKIDRSFIRDLPASTEDGVLVKTILSMARNLSLKVIAEGVETRPQEAFLKAFACRYIQGYLYSKPLPEADLLEYISQR